MSFFRPLPTPIALPHGELSGWLVVAMAARDSITDPPTVLSLRVINPTLRTSSFYQIPVSKDTVRWTRREGPCFLSPHPYV